MAQANADRLTAAAKAAADKIAEQQATITALTAQLAQASDSSVPNTVVDAASAELEQAVNPPAPSPTPDPNPTPDPAPGT